ncbi:pirin family protein [Cellvibrio sp. ARAG 10.3]|uniref:pirin family protein n=1 Tax=Cellvibrio sp. ARAG 10.3 TaxID=3451358 RepID=UPI003F44EC49
MSWLPDAEPQCVDHAGDVSPVELIIEPKARDLGDFEVRRVLPSSKRQMVGPFIFFDHMGPAHFGVGQGMDVRPHPHIGLATVTYLYSGSILHRDSLGCTQLITPGAINWMTAGRGITHSERSSDQARQRHQVLEGLQLWVALPKEHEEVEPSFVHYPPEDLPELDRDGARIRVLAGHAFGVDSPVKTLSPLVYVDIALHPGKVLQLDVDYAERAIYVVKGEITLAGETYAAGRMLVLRKNSEVTFRADEETQLVVVGGEPLDGPRIAWWNFVSSSRERIEQAKADWQAGRFAQVPGETEFIPLPDR